MARRVGEGRRPVSSKFASPGGPRYTWLIMHSRRWIVGLPVVAFGLLVACGSRTGLYLDGPIDDEPIADEVPRFDASVMDVVEPLPGIDGQARPDVDQRDCTDPSETLVYLVSSDAQGQNHQLYSFDPRNFSLALVSPIACPSVSSPFSMAVDREGVAYVLYFDGELFRVSTRTGACVATTFRPGQVPSFERFGMGFASDTGGAEETLFVASAEDRSANATSELATIGVPSFDLDVTGPFPSFVQSAELTGSGDGRLFAFYTKAGRTGSFIGQIDKRTASVVAETPLPTIEQGNGWAFAFWGGDFYTFTSPGGIVGSLVHRVRLSDGSVEQVATVPQLIVGAGVSTCSPVN